MTVSIQPKPDTGLIIRVFTIFFLKKRTKGFNPAEARYGFNTKNPCDGGGVFWCFNPAEARYGFNYQSEIVSNCRLKLVSIQPKPDTGLIFLINLQYYE